MADTRRLRVSEMDFDEIKKNLKSFLSDQTTLTDYDFEGSAFSTLIDAMAYITHMNAVNANQAINETFLDTAQLRSSVVSHAKLLGYVPRSAFASIASVNIQVNDPPNPGMALTMAKGTLFTSTIDGISYNFTTLADITIQPDMAGEYHFLNVPIYQGQWKQTDYVFDNNSSEKLTIPYDNVVTSTLEVKIFPSQGSTSQDIFTYAPNTVNIQPDSDIYFLNETVTGLYEITFGDGVFGTALANGNYLQFDYVITDGDAANGAKIFALAGTIDGASDVTITTLNEAGGGSPREDLNSIKFNAPLLYTAQNRAVTPDDYKAILLNNFANIEAITVWGGEDSDPPDYGRVYITIAPKDSEFLTQLEKDTIIEQILKTKNVVSITPVILDPTYTYIELNVFFKYNPNATSSDVDTLEEAVRQEIAHYNEDELKRFDGVFRMSKLLGLCDDSDASILNTTIRAKMKKRFVPVLGVESLYTLSFPNAIWVSSLNSPVLSSTPFTYQGKTCVLRDFIDTNNNNQRVIKVVEQVSGTVRVQDAGYIDESDGKVVISGFAPTAITGSYIEVTVLPNSYDLAPKRNELLEILVDSMVIEGEIDTMITGGTSAGINYNTTTRF